MKNALILDRDLGFGFWLARGFDQAHYQAYPAKTVPDAASLLQELRLAVDLLVLDPALPGAAEFIESIRRSNEQLKVIALIGEQPHLPALAARVDLCCRKPDRTDTKRREWIEHVEELLPVSLFGAAFENSALVRKCAGALAWHAHPAENRSGLPSWREWKSWERCVVDGRFPLERYLGGGAHSGVFLTRLGDAAQSPAALKLVLADKPHCHTMLSRWERAAVLSHPGLLRLHGMGNAELDGISLLYVVMEYADENLAEVLRQRPLTPAEARETLEPVLDALAYIHDRGFVHGRVKPSNILAVADRLKISSDAVQPAGERVFAAAKPGAYDPPETAAGVLSPAADVWSLGITLVEALTQRPPQPKRSPHKPPAIPVALPPLFLDIARHCLEPDPSRRETVAHLAGRLRQPQAVAPESTSASLPRRRLFALRPYAVSVVAAALLLSGILMYPLHRTAARVSVQPSPPKAQPVAPPAPPAAAPVVAPALPPAPHPRQVATQVLPEISQEAQDTIRGEIEVRVRATVDASGAVTAAALESAGPSRYFANRALAAAQKWKFEPAPESEPEEWILGFTYSKTGTRVSGQRAE